MARILLYTYGSSGDINPYLALAYALRERGHEPHFAVGDRAAPLIRSLGFPVEETHRDLDWDDPLVKEMLKPSRNGLPLVRRLFLDLLIPAIPQAVETVTPLAREFDLFVAHSVHLAAPVIARRAGVPWVTAMPACLVYPTATLIPGVTWKHVPASVARMAWGVAHQVWKELDTQANAQYAALGEPPVRDIVVGGVYSRELTVGLWSPAYFPRPSDWPDWFQIGGYGRWDAPAPPDAPEVEIPAPGPDAGPLVVFTLGSSVVSDPRGFYEMALEAVAPTNWRALLVGAPDGFAIPPGMRRRVAAVRYAPYSEVLPQADAVVHAGGVGATQATLYYGVPAVIVPRASDQFENAAHVQREGWGLRLKPEDLSSYSLRYRLQRLFATPGIYERAEALGAAMRAEPGAFATVDRLETRLGQPPAALTSTPR